MKTFSQETDTICIQYNRVLYGQAAKENFDKRYEYTAQSLQRLLTEHDFDRTELIISYPQEQIAITTIPIFKLKTINDKPDKNNILYFIDFENDFQKQNYNLYFKDSLLMDSRVESEDFDNEVGYILWKVDYTKPRFGNMSGFLYDLSLEKKHFTFLIEEFPPDVFFTLENEKIYANYLRKNKLLKTEINEFIFKEMKKSDFDSLLVRNHLHIKNYETLRENYNSNYFVDLRIENVGKN